MLLMPRGGRYVAAGGGGGSTPATILGADVIEWFDMTASANLRQTIAGGTSVTGGDPVGTALGNESAFDYVGTADDTTRPTFNASGYLEFDGSNDRLKGALSSSGATYVAMRLQLPTQPTSGTRHFMCMNLDERSAWYDNPYAHLVDPSGNDRIEIATDNGLVSQAGFSRTGWHTLEAWVDTNLKGICYDGGTDITSTATYAPPTIGATILGVEFSFNDFQVMNLAGIVFASAVPGSTERADLRTWLGDLA